MAALPRIGLTGLGVMGRNLALNIADNGFDIAVHNRTSADVDDFLSSSGDLWKRLSGHQSIEAFITGIEKPRTIILMVKAGSVVDSVIGSLLPHLDQGDLIIDAGNSDFNDTVRRTLEIEQAGFGYVGMGVSGGEVGARFGPSIMVGGSRLQFDRIRDVILAISAKHEGDPCADWLGPDGAGHFVKTLHNGIEYGDMQMIAETYGIMRFGLAMSPAEIADVFKRWNEGALKSYLIEITGEILGTLDPDTQKPIIDIIVDRAGQKGTGRWSVIESQKLASPATTIEAAVAARALSAQKELRKTAEAVYGDSASPAPIDQATMVDDLEQALLAGKIVAYAQGFEVLAEASREYGWNLPLSRIAEIWREGCIIRSVFLNDISAVFRDNATVDTLLLAPAFVDRMQKAAPSLRKTVGYCVAHSLPAPALSAALNHFDYFRQGQSTANVLQAQRDFFGAHGFERTDKDGSDFHGPWAMG